MGLQIDSRDGDPRGAQHRLGDLIRLTGKGDHRAVMIGDRC